MPRHRIHGKPTRVRFLDPHTGRSLSFTVFGAELGQVADYVELRIRERWRSTSLIDRRHRRRLS